MRKEKVNAGYLPVMKSHRKTCPFRIVNGHMHDIQLAAKVTERTLFKAHQICHGTKGENGEWNNRCKGSYDNNLVIYERLAMINKM